MFKPKGIPFPCKEGVKREMRSSIVCHVYRKLQFHILSLLEFNFAQFFLKKRKGKKKIAISYT